MTGSELYRHALALMSLTSVRAKGYEELALPILNELLADCFAVNNTLREEGGLSPLEEVPRMASLTGEIPFEEELCRRVLPFGLASMLLLEDDGGRSQWLYERYEHARSQTGRALFEQIESAY